MLRDGNWCMLVFTVKLYIFLQLAESLILLIEINCSRSTGRFCGLRGASKFGASQSGFLVAARGFIHLLVSRDELAKNE